MTTYSSTILLYRSKEQTFLDSPLQKLSKNEDKMIEELSKAFFILKIDTQYNHTLHTHPLQKLRVG